MDLGRDPGRIFIYKPLFSLVFSTFSFFFFGTYIHAFGAALENKAELSAARIDVEALSPGEDPLVVAQLGSRRQPHRDPNTPILDDDA